MDLARCPGPGPARVALVAALVAAAGVAPLAGAAGEPRETRDPAAEAGDAPPAEPVRDEPKKDDAPAAHRRAAPPHASDFPPGVTLLVPRAAARLEAAMFPPGVTVLRGPAAAPEGEARPKVVVRVERRRPPAPGGPSEADEADETDDALARALATPVGPPAREAGTAGPSLGEQLAVFGGGPQTAGRVGRDTLAWRPVSAWPEREPGGAYPWQPARWSEPSFDQVWTPVSSWPPRESGAAYPWQPARWSARTIETSWSPRDAWGRSVGIAAPPAADATSAPPAPATGTEAAAGQPSATQAE